MLVEQREIAVGPFDVTLNLVDRACGNIIEIDGSTGDEVANNDVWWRARLITIGMEWGASAVALLDRLARAEPDHAAYEWLLDGARR